MAENWAEMAGQPLQFVRLGKGYLRIRQKNLSCRRRKGKELQSGLTSSNFVEAYSVVCCSFPVPIILKQKLRGYTKSFKSENIIYIALFWKIQNWGTK